MLIIDSFLFNENTLQDIIISNLIHLVLEGPYLTILLVAAVTRTLVLITMEASSLIGNCWKLMGLYQYKKNRYFDFQYVNKTVMRLSDIYNEGFVIDKMVY